MVFCVAVVTYWWGGAGRVNEPPLATVDEGQPGLSVDVEGQPGPRGTQREHVPGDALLVQFPRVPGCREDARHLRYGCWWGC